MGSCMGIKSTNFRVLIHKCFVVLSGCVYAIATGVFFPHLPEALADPLPIKLPLKIVSIGASYASGHGISPIIDGGCQRSAHNYAHLVAAALHAELTDVSCSGATTDNFSTPQGFNGPQYHALTGNHNIVLVSIGSNDIQLIQSTIFCLWFEQGNSPSCPSNRANSDRKLVDWRHKIRAAYTHVRLLEPHAQIYAISYGRPFSTSENTCENAPLNYDVRSWFTQRLDTLSNYTKDSIAAVHGHFVDASVISAGHSICSQDPWYVGTELANGDGFILHPRAKWHQAIAAYILQSIRTHTGN